MKNRQVMRIVAVAAVAVLITSPSWAQAPTASQEAASLRQELVGLQIGVGESADGKAKRKQVSDADLALRQAMLAIPEFQALEARRAQLREEMKALTRQQAALEAKYAAQLAPQRKARDAAAQQLKILLDGNPRAEQIKQRLSAIAPVAGDTSAAGSKLQ